MLITKSRLISSQLLSLAAAVAWCELAIAEPQANYDKAPDEMIEAAESAYQATNATYQVGRVTIEDVYQWSHRVVEATMIAEDDPEVQKAALVEHVNRMTKLYRQVMALHANSAEGGEEHKYWAAKYYMLAATHELAVWEKSHKVK